jgi:hypothetical protein
MNYYRDQFQQSILSTFFPGYFCDWDWESTEAFKEDPTVAASVYKESALAAKTYFDMGLALPQIAKLLDNPLIDPAYSPVKAAPTQKPTKVSFDPEYSHSRSHLVVYADKEFLREHAVSSLQEIKGGSHKLTSFTLTFMDQCSGSSIKKAGFWEGKWSAAISPILQETYRLGVVSAYASLKQDPPKEVAVDSTSDTFVRVMSWGEKIVSGSVDASERKSLMNRIPSIAEKALHQLYNNGKYDTLKKLGVDDIYWCCGKEDGHEEINGLVVRIGSKYPVVGQQYPGELGGAPCTCTIFPSTVKKVEEKFIIKS